MRRYPNLVACLAALPAAAAVAGGGSPWLNFTEQTAAHLLADPEVGAADTQEKDYAWADVDGDGDIDLVAVRKQPFSTTGARRNVLFLNEGGVLTDRTAEYVPGFLDLTNDRDVQLVDVDNDSWPDIVTAAACYSGSNCPGVPTDESRLYLNLGSDGGAWLGFGAPQVLLDSGNLNAVAAGDLTGDGYVDLYFVSSNDALEDQLLINGGPDNRGVFTIENERLTLAMRTSGFGASAAIADFNGDSWYDIAKVEVHSLELFYNDGGGIFLVMETFPNMSEIHVSAGDLNADAMQDLVVSNDGLDRYHLNQGNGADGLADFSALLFPPSTNGFGGNSVITDLDGDGWRDVLIADVDPDAPGCTRIADILRNGGDPPAVTFAVESTGIPDTALTGVFDIAVFDVNGDGGKDLVLGRCSGTQVWLMSPALFFAYPDELPAVIEPGQITTFHVQLLPVLGSVEPGSPAIHVSIEGGPFVQSPLQPLGGELYQAALPAADCLEDLDFYLAASVTGGPAFTDPPSAPAGTYVATAIPAVEVVFSDSLEGDVSGWTVQSDPSLTAGEWQAVTPMFTMFNGAIANPSEDATSDGTIAFVTQNPPFANSAATSSDVDWGPTYLVSPVIDLEGTDARIAFSYWAFSDIGIPDVLVVEVSNDGGSTWTAVKDLEDSGSAWAADGFVVGAFVEPTSTVRVRFGIADSPNDSITEAGIDDFEVGAIACCPWDIDSDGAVGVTDLLSLLAAWGTDPQGAPDFDGDGSVGVIDLLAMLGRFGPCPE